MQSAQASLSASPTPCLKGSTDREAETFSRPPRAREGPRAWLELGLEPAPERLEVAGRIEVVEDRLVGGLEGGERLRRVA